MLHKMEVKGQIMRSSKICAILLIALLAFAFASGLWASKSIEYEKLSQDVHYIVEQYHAATADPENGSDSFIMLAQQPEYAKYALVNMIALALTDVHYPRLSEIIYHSGITHMGIGELRAFVSNNGDRILEQDRAEFEPANYPEGVAVSMARHFENRPIIILSSRETKTLMACQEHIEQEGIDPRSPWARWLGLEYRGDDPCQELKKLR